MNSLRILPLALLACGGLSLPLYAAEDAIPEPLPALTDRALDIPPPTAEAGLPSPAPEAMVPTAPVPVLAHSTPSPAELLQQQNLELVPQHIALFRNTVRSTTTSKNLFARLLSSASTPLDLALLADMERFILRHVALPETAEVFYLRGLVHQRIEQPQAAAVDWLLLRVLYPDSPFAAEAARQIEALRGDALKKQAALLDELQRHAQRMEGDRDARLAAFLMQLGTVNDERFAPAIAAACAAFLNFNTSWLHEDRIVYARARQSALIDPVVAIYHYNQLLALYADSPLRPDSLLAIGNIQRNELKQYELAVKSYARLIADYPEAPQSKLAYEAQALTYEQDLRDYSRALQSHQAIVAKYGTDPVVLRSLQAAALLYQNRVNQPDKAIDSYLQLAELFKGAEGLDALNKAERIALNTTHDWQRALDINQRIIALVPDSEDAVKARYTNAELAENKLNDKELAKKWYEEVIAHHPKHRLAAEARKRLAALNPPPAQ